MSSKALRLNIERLEQIEAMLSRVDFSEAVNIPQGEFTEVEVSEIRYIRQVRGENTFEFYARERDLIKERIVDICRRSYRLVN